MRDAAAAAAWTKGKRQLDKKNRPYTEIKAADSVFSSEQNVFGRLFIQLTHNVSSILMRVHLYRGTCSAHRVLYRCQHCRRHRRRRRQ